MTWPDHPWNIPPVPVRDDVAGPPWLAVHVILFRVPDFWMVYLSLL